MQIATPTPDACFGDISWSAITAGTDQSVLAGVLAGFVFAGIVAVLGVRSPNHGRDAARALKMMFSAFIGLAVSAYLLADQAADTNCLRAAAEETFAGSILGTFAIIQIASLTWLIAAYNMQRHGVLRFLRQLIYVGSAFVVILLCTSSSSLLQSDIKHGPSAEVVTWLYVTGFLIYAVWHPVTLRNLKPVIAKITGAPDIGHLHGLRKTEDAGIDKKDRVDFCAWMSLLYLAVAAIGDAYVISSSDKSWRTPSVAAIYASAWSSLVVPLIVLLLALNVLAPERLDRDTGEKSYVASTEQDQWSTETMPRKHEEKPSYDLVKLVLTWVTAYGLIRISRRRRRLGHIRR